MSIYYLFSILVGVTALALLLYTIIFRSSIARFISAGELGIFEKDLPNLKQVIVLANKVERPNDRLAEAVEDNFGEKVSYLFLVSNSKADEEVSGYYLIFEALAKKVAAEKKDSSISVNELVTIKQLPYDWDDVPYIFYQYTVDGSSNRYTIAFRGNEKREGIAEYYEKLSPSRSSTLVSALLSEAPQEIRANLTLVDNVVGMPKSGRKKQ